MTNRGYIFTITIFGILFLGTMLADDVYAETLYLVPDQTAVLCHTIIVNVADSSTQPEVRVNVAGPPNDEITITLDQIPETNDWRKEVFVNEAPNKCGEIPTGMASIDAKDQNTFTATLASSGASFSLLVKEPGIAHPIGTRTVIDLDLRASSDPATSCPGNLGGDADKDMVCDAWEDSGDLVIPNGNFIYTYDCDPACDRYAPDLFIEIDYMEGHEPDPEALDDIVAAFLAQGIRVHFQLDPQFSLAHDPDIPFPGYQLSDTQYNGFDQWKGAQFGTPSERYVKFGSEGGWSNDPNNPYRQAKHQVFHYCIFVHERLWAPGQSGVAEIDGNDCFISLGWATGEVGSTDQQAGTLMHEIGHMLRLNHGGFVGDPTNNKPNHFSVMSYARQFADLDAARDLELSGIMLGQNPNQDFLDEEHLDETQGMEQHPNASAKVIYSCPDGQIAPLLYDTTGEIDWNCDETMEDDVESDINDLPVMPSGNSKEQLDGWSDWDPITNLDFYFNDNVQYSDGRHDTGIEELETPGGLDEGAMEQELLSQHIDPADDSGYEFVQDNDEPEINLEMVTLNRESALLSLLREIGTTPPGLFDSDIPGSGPYHVSGLMQYPDNPIIFVDHKVPSAIIPAGAILAPPDPAHLPDLHKKHFKDEVIFAINAINHHDLDQAKKTVMKIDSALKTSLNPKAEVVSTQITKNILKTYDKALNFKTNDFHDDSVHKPLNDPILEISELQTMIKDVEIFADGLNLSDKDSDGIPDRYDECENESGHVSDDGCPDTSGPGPIFELDIRVPQGTSVPGCESTNECFNPPEVTIGVGGEVTWTNDDTAAHTVTSGSASDGPSGVFDSSLFMAGATFSHTFEEAGVFPYFCMVHPWMEGIVTVQEADAEDDDAMEGDLMVAVTDSAVKGGTQVDLEFSELHVNYEITATQDGEIILQETAHAMEMTASHMVDAVGSDDNPIDIEIVSLGIGAPGSEDDWTGPVGSVATAKVVPEFGTVPMMILVVAIISIVAVTTKSRVIPRL